MDAERMERIAMMVLRNRPERLRTSTDLEDAIQDGWVGHLQGRDPAWEMIDAMHLVRAVANGGSRRAVEVALSEPQDMDDMPRPCHESRVMAARQVAEVLGPHPRRTQEWAMLQWGIGLTMDEIADMYGVTTARVCQVLRALGTCPPRRKNKHTKEMS